MWTVFTQDSACRPVRAFVSTSYIFSIILIIYRWCNLYAFRISHQHYNFGVIPCRRNPEGSDKARMNCVDSIKLLNLDGKNGFNGLNIVLNASKSSFIGEIVKRGILSQTTNYTRLDDFIYEHEEHLFGRKKLDVDINLPIPAVYCGIDLTNDFIHEGTLLQLFLLRRFLSHGFNVVIILGGGTTIIGDPSFRSRRSKNEYTVIESPLSTKNFIFNRKTGIIKVNEVNERNIFEIVRKVLMSPVTTITGDLVNPKLIHQSLLEEDSQIKCITNTPHNVIVLNNRDIYDGVRLMDYLENVAKNMSMGRMLSRESIKARMTYKNASEICSFADGERPEPKGINMNLAEFLYMTLQAMDFIYVASKFNALIQIGGSDQMGNIMAGIELGDEIESLKGNIFGITTPLLKDSAGEKISKSDGNCLLKITSSTKPLSFWTYFRNLDDSVIRTYLKLLTNVPLDVIESKISSHINCAKILLADELTTTVYGKSFTDSIHKFWLSKDLERLKMYFNDNFDLEFQEFQSLIEFIKCAPNFQISTEESKQGVTFGAILNKLRTKQLTGGTLYSNNRAIRDGACKINGRTETKVDYLITYKDFRVVSNTKGEEYRYILIQFGKRQIYFVTLKDD